ncbi:MAG: hypothetical protein HRU12_08150, partial [Phaeodactylibacter sp.]|nr:hypothetical protein [Phaeodactylibacter sp.]
GTGCQLDESVIIDTLNPSPELTITPALDTICEHGCAELALSLTGTAPFALNYTVLSGVDTLSFDLSTVATDTTISFCPADSLLGPGDLIWQFGLVSDANCSDSLSILDTITVLPTIRDTIAPSLCTTEDVTINGVVYDINNSTGIDTLFGAASTGCDSIVVVMLDFFPVDTNFIVQTLCTGSSLTVNGTLYDETTPSGFETILNGSVTGCDSLISVNLTFQDAVFSAISDTLCPGESLTINGTLYDETNPSGADTLINGSINGCDSIIMVSLAFFPADTNFIVQTLCTGSSLTVNGMVYDETTPSGFEIISNGTVNGCDSLISIDLTFQNAIVNTITQSLCPGDSLTVNGTLYDENNLTGSDTLFNGSVIGCDSIINVTISYWSIDTNYVSPVLCSGDSLVVNGTTFNAANPAGTEVISGGADNGCDSIMVVSLTFLPADTNFITSTLCNGESITVNGTVYDAVNPTGFETIPNGATTGCDSLVSISLTFEDALVNAVSDTLCLGESLTINGVL